MVQLCVIVNEIGGTKDIGENEKDMIKLCEKILLEKDVVVNDLENSKV